MSGKARVTRRRVLETVGAGAGTAGVVTGASAGDSREYVIGLEAGADLSVATAPALSVTNELDFGNIGRVVAGRYSDRAVRSVRQRPAVRYAVENGQMHAVGATSGHSVTASDIGDEVPYGIELTGATQTITDGVTGEGVTIAIVDTGIELSHETLAGNIVSGYATDSAECIDLCEEPYEDDNGHGTHVAGTAAAEQNNTGVVGVAPDADLLAVKVLTNAGTGAFDEIAEGIEWAVDNGADVINLSLGAKTQSFPVDDAIEYAVENNVVVAAAAGNGGPCEDCVIYPAKQSEAIAVSATTEADGLASFSSTGPEVEIAAPGEEVYSADRFDGYEYKSGTSMATPHVAGAAAVALSGGLPPGTVREALTDAAVDIGLGDTEQGAGRLDVPGAVDDPDPLVVSTGEADDIGETTATFVGTATYVENGPADVWFEYGPAGSGLPEVVDAGTAGTGEAFAADVSGLEPDTAYEFVAVASTGAESDEGQVRAFETDAEDDGGFCFITTATADDAETRSSLRRFRDDSMRATPVGRGLVGLYYRVSPPIARTLDRHPDSSEVALVHSLVDRCGSLADTQAATDSRVASAALGVVLTMLYVVGLAVGAAGHASLRIRETLGR
jgi:subtilisin